MELRYNFYINFISNLLLYLVAIFFILLLYQNIILYPLCIFLFILPTRTYFQRRQSLFVTYFIISYSLPDA